MRLDHIAYRVNDREKTAQFFIDAFGYSIQTEFEINFPDGSTAKCIALEPPEKVKDAPWEHISHMDSDQAGDTAIGYHLPPEIFVSDGTSDSIVRKWVANRNGIGGIHHLAYQVESVERTMALWKEKGFAEFTSEDVLRCPGLTQVFTKPSELTGVIYEFIEREEHGFCKENVLDLMSSTEDLE